MLFYLLAYAVTNLGAFGVLALLASRSNEHDEVRDFAGLWEERPGLAALLTVFLLSLGGFPPTAGFIAKWYIFTAAVQEGHFALAIIGVLTSVVSVFYYLRIVVMMYMSERAHTERRRPGCRRPPTAALAMSRRRRLLPRRLSDRRHRAGPRARSAGCSRASGPRRCLPGPCRHRRSIPSARGSTPSRRTGPSRASGPTWTWPSSRPTRNWRRSTRTCAWRCRAPASAGRAAGARSRSPSRSRASTARTTTAPWRWPGRRASTSRRGRATTSGVRARFQPDDAPALRDLYQLVGDLPGTDVLIDDRPVPYARELWLPLFWCLLPR